MNHSDSILATISYHDIFNYPLKKSEIKSLLIGKNLSAASLEKKLNEFVFYDKIETKKELFFLKKRKKIVSVRLSRKDYSLKKLKIAKMYSKILKIIPTIQLVGISGALSMGNSTKFDDIDLVIITARNRLWTTRFLANVLLFPVKRKPGSRKTDNRACLNLFLDESDLRIYDENIYQAHEICQLKPIWQRNNAYYRFIKANSWVKKYLPNWQTPSINNQRPVLRSHGEGGSTINNHQEKFFFEKSSINNLFSWIENFLKKLQLFYMKRKISTERIGDSQLFFHPGGTQEYVLKEYQKRLKSLLTYDKVI